MNLGQVLQHAVNRNGGALAVVDGEVRRSYDAWYGEIRAVAGGLASRGIAGGDHVAVVMRNRHEMATIGWAAYLLGAIFTPISWRGSAEEIAYCLRDAEAKLVAFDGSAEAALHEACETAGLAADRRIGAADAKWDGPSFADLAAGAPVDGPSGADMRETALTLYTSGTTGRPKGVPRSHLAEHAAAMSHIALNQYPVGLSSLCVMPLFHTMGVRVLLSSAILNGPLVLQPTYSAGGVLDIVERERIGGIFLVPTMFHDVLGQPDIERRDLSSVVRAGYAGMTMAPSLVEKCVERFPAFPFVNFYGSSEIYTFAASLTQDAKPGCAGQPGPYQSLRVVTGDPDRKVGPGEIVPAGETGEIIASMSALDAFSGYWKRPDADEKAIRDGWYFTGDLGRIDDDGELWVMGRVDDMIISGGENIHPEEVEDVLLRSGLLRDVVVVGLPDDRMGQRVAAFVEGPADGATADALDAVCSASALAGYKRPRGYAFIDAIPRSASGKLLRRKLRDGDYTLLTGFESTV